MREIVLRAGDAADGEVAQAALDAWAAKRLATFEDAERGLMFGRLDFEAVERALYVGRRWVHDDEGEQVVVNWQAPAAQAVLHGDAAGPAARHAPPPLPRPGAQARRHRRRGARRLDARRRQRRRLPARGARAQPRHAHARHRRDDPGRPVPPDHPRARAAARDPGRAGHREDGRRPPPRLVADLHRAGEERAQPRPRRRAEPDVHGVRLARPSRPRRGKRRAARRRPSSSPASSRRCGTRPTSRG